jgi:uncharacterized phage protein (TIGR02220 family)/predicted phage replisome organizer
MKRFYWIKLKEDFFNQIAIKKLRKIAGGDTFTIIYLKMLLLALKNEGMLVHEGIEDTFEKELALLLDEDLENIKMTLMYLSSHSLIEQNENRYFLPESIVSTGSETDSADRVRRFRQKNLDLQTKYLVTDNSILLQSNNDVTISNIDIDKDKEKELNKDIEEIIEYLNNVCNSKFRFNDKNKSLIKARLKEGYSKDDFFLVINKKFNEWNNTEYEKYLRPLTLFGNKFENYVNQKEYVKKSKFEKTKDSLVELYKKYEEA